jgi:hypothetical protein
MSDEASSTGPDRNWGEMSDGEFRPEPGEWYHLNGPVRVIRVGRVWATLEGAYRQRARVRLGTGELHPDDRARMRGSFYTVVETQGAVVAAEDRRKAWRRLADLGLRPIDQRTPAGRLSTGGLNALADLIEAAAVNEEAAR